MTCGSILWLKISPQSCWITCRNNFGNQQIHWAACETELEEKGIVSLSDPSLSLGKLLPLPPSPRGCTHPHSRLSASRGWTALVSRSVRVLGCEGESRFCVPVCGVFCSIVWFCLPFFFPVFFPPNSLQKIKKGWRFKGTVAFVLMSASCVIALIRMWCGSDGLDDELNCSVE